MKRVFHELQRRNVVKVALAYLAVAWLLIQLVGEIGPILDVPEWFPRLVLVLLVAGFVITVILAWIYEITDRGIRTTGEVDSDTSLEPAHGKALNFIIIGALSLALGYFIWESRFANFSDPAVALESIAVLPFSDMSEAGDQEHFADGMAEELANLLSRLPGLKVAGRTSSFSFKGSDKAIRQIAEELSVTHVLEGSVRTSGSRLRVTAQLIKAEDGFQLWSQTYDRNLNDIFAVQDEIAAAVTQGLKVHLGGDAADRLPTATATQNMQAYNDYLLGRYHLARRTEEGLRTALAHFRSVVETDPGYSPAWSGLAKTLVVSPWYTPLATPGELAEEIRQAASRALELDPGNSEAYAVLGTLYMVFDQDWERAAAELKKSVDLHPNNAGNANLYGDYLYIIGDYQAALEYEGLAAELEPLSASNQHELALVMSLRGRLEEAIEQERLAVRLNPEFANAWMSLARMLLESGDADAALQVLENQRSGLGERRVQMLEFRIALQQGDIQRARRLATSLLDVTRQTGHSLAQIALLFALLGDDAQSAELLRQALELGDPLLSSPLYFFLPEDWQALPKLREALDHPGLRVLFDFRRQFIATGRGRVLYLSNVE